ncbi:MAG: hypothetical protein AAGH79_02480 [Bacteroidota bacterium]
MNQKTFLSILMILGLIFAGAGDLSAQKMTKKEKKKWKKEAKKLKKNPEQLAQLKGQVSDLKKEKLDLEQQLTNVQSATVQKDKKIEELERNYYSALAELEQTKASFEEFSDPQGDPEVLPMGIIFRVQIGAYRENQLGGELDTTEELNLEQSEDIQKIVVGQYRTYDEADSLRAGLQRMGVQDAWIVSYRDGNRITIEEALNQ